MLETPKQIDRTSVNRDRKHRLNGRFNLRFTGQSLVFFAVSLCVSCATTLSSFAQTDGPPSQTLTYIVVDADTGSVLSESGAREPVHPAALAEIMTLYLLFDDLDNGKIRLSGQFRVSPFAASMPPGKLGVREGDDIPVETTILSMALRGDNDTAVVAGENLAGTESDFVNRMNKKAKELGMNNTRFSKSSGWPDQNLQITTAEDISILTKDLIKNHGMHYHYFSEDSFYYAGKEYKNRNHLIDIFPGVDGVRTGYTTQSGFNIAVSAVRDGHRMIGVLIGAETAAARDRLIAKLLDAAFARIGAQ